MSTIWGLENIRQEEEPREMSGPNLIQSLMPCMPQNAENSLGLTLNTSVCGGKNRMIIKKKLRGSWFKMANSNLLVVGGPSTTKPVQLLMPCSTT